MSFVRFQLLHKSLCPLRIKSALISQVKVFLVTANPSPLLSVSLQSVIAGCIIIPLDLHVISVSDGSLSVPPCHYTAYKCRFLSEGSSDFASPGAPWKYDSHAACHMRPPARLWDIGSLFIELARPCKPWARHKLSFDQPPLEIPLGAH